MLRSWALILAFACGLLSFATRVAGSTNHHVILVTIDGLASYYLDDPQAPIPTLRMMAGQGAAAEGMRVSNPAVTWPNHTTLVTGVRPDKHSVFFNGVLMRGAAGVPVKVDPARSKADLVAVPTLYDQLHRAGYRCAGVNWPCTRGAVTLEDDFSDVPDQVVHMTPRLRDELIASGVLQGTNQALFQKLSGPARDQVWMAVAAHVLKQRRPNFMMFHLLITDFIQHRHGPQTPAAYTALALADAHMAELLRAIDAAGLGGRTTVLVTADHGFEKALKLVNPNVVFRKAGLVQTASAPGLVQARVQSISEGGIAMVYCTDPATVAEDRAKVVEMLKGQEGIAEIWGPEKFGAAHFPDPTKNRQMADLVLVAAEGYAFNNEARGEEVITDVTLATGNQGHHGYVSTNPKMNAAFIAWGRGIRRGAKLGVIENIDVAPTIARLLGQELPGADGRVIKELLAE